MAKKRLKIALAAEPRVIGEIVESKHTVDGIWVKIKLYDQAVITDFKLLGVSLSTQGIGTVTVIPCGKVYVKSNFSEYLCVKPTGHSGECYD